MPQRAENRLFDVTRHAALILTPWLLFAAPACLSAQAQAQALDHAVVGGHSIYCVRAGDSLTAISARYGAPASTIARLNGLDERKPIHPGQCLQIDNRHIVPGTLDNGLLINLPQRMLYLFEGGALAAAYPVGLGRPSWPTPVGSFQIVELRENPTWHVPVSIQEEMRRAGKVVLTRVPPGPENPLGKFWIGLSMAGYGIHSTNAPPSVYHFQTHGCIRLHPDDMQQLFARVSVGLRGEIVYLPVLLAELADHRIELEVNPDIYDKRIDAWEVLMALAAEHGLTERIDWQRAAEVVKQREGLARRIDRQPTSSADALPQSWTSPARN
ncbi:MAG: L,D-transpeptidase family protein [Thiomonas sp.]|uniref:L,D-transpeptidase family protein n=1 Tax=Thiomonas sp. TaxID=2047785 RepID=UPI002A35EC12|nr:L,D-transpeptidase family protein [Thiomonas sp.]MDY0330090.1 L,D-transpeptidase family protein [Thiomonas sp.]